MSQEAAIMAARLHKVTGAGTLSYFGDTLHSKATADAVALLDRDNAASQEDVRQAGLIALLACDLLDAAPMMALAVRQAWRNEAKVYVVKSEHLRCTPHKLYESIDVASLADIPLADAPNPVVICGANRSGLECIQGATLTGVKLAFILNGPNAFGTALLARGQGVVSLPEALVKGTIKGVITLESDLEAVLPPDIRVLAAADWMPSHLTERAEIVLPVTSWVEMDGTYINHEGRAQRFKQVMRPGAPIKGEDPELHPPRSHRHDPPGGDMLPSWKIVSELLKRLGDEQCEDICLSGEWNLLSPLDSINEGIMIYERNQKQ
jgi:NADH-quinone oxidoreductase subunit G